MVEDKFEYYVNFLKGERKAAWKNAKTCAKNKSWDRAKFYQDRVKYLAMLIEMATMIEKEHEREIDRKD